MRREDLTLDARLRALVAQAPEAIVISDDETRIIEFNPAAERLFAVGRDWAIGRTAYDIAIDQQATEAELAQLRGVFEGSPARYTTTRAHQDGRRVVIELEVSPLRDEQGAVFGAFAIGRDVTARVRAERRAGFLAEASHVLSGSLDLQPTLDRITSLLLPHWADVAAIALCTEDGRLEPTALQHADPERLENARALFLASTQVELPEPVRERVLGAGEAVVLTDFSASATLRASVLRAAVVAPLRVRGTVLGVLAAAMTDRSGRTFEAADVDLIRSLGDRAAQAIDNARLLQAEREARSAAERAALETQAADARFRAAFEHAPAGIALLRAVDADLVYVEVNPALCEIAGYPPEELLGHSVQEFLHPEDAGEETRRAMAAMAAGERDEDHREFRHIRPDGELRWVKTHLAPLQGTGGERTFVAQVQDVTDRRRFERELEHLATHDPLTGLLNRRRFEEELEKAFAQVRRHGDEAAVIVLDLDDFKHVNDTYGHATGDHLLRLAAHELRDRVRSTDAVARLGGDEFGIVLTRTSLEEATAVAEGLLERFRSVVAVRAGQRTVRATASAGVRSLVADAEVSAGDLLGEADLAMYDAKDRGRDRVSVVGAADLRPERIRARIRWAERIRDALERERFVLYEQPILSLRTGEVERAELLIRMLDSADGAAPIPPGAFLPVAERYGHIREIDRWVVRTAIALLAERQRAGSPVGAEVNLSGDSLTDASVIDFIVAEIRNAGIDASALTFEVTETAAIGNFERARRLAAQLSDLGCAFALDDFGAGFGSFAYLKHLPFASIKIDGEFIRTLPRSPSDQVTVRGVVDIARALGKQTVGEFVEDAETLVLLRRLGVDRAQGFFVGHPRPAVPAPDFGLPATGVSRPG